MGRRLFLAYVAIVFGPLALATAAFAIRDFLARRGLPPSAGNGHAEADALEDTVEEVKAT